MKGYDALKCTLISRGYDGKHLGRLSELGFLADKVARFLFEFHADDYKGLRITCELLGCDPSIYKQRDHSKILKTHHVCI